MLKSLYFSDIRLLKRIQPLYSADYYSRDQRQSVAYVPIDCARIAEQLNVNAEMIFHRLYYHLNKKYAYIQEDGSKVYMFSPVVGSDRHCINYPYLCAVLADLLEKQEDMWITRSIALASLVISIIALW